MLSTHGYFDPLPQLGRTDTGGQVVYVLQLARALTGHGIKVDIYTRWFDPSRQQVDPLPECPDARVIRIPAGSWEFIAKEKIYALLPELAENMVAFIRTNGIDYDLLHGHYIDAGVVAVDATRALGRPVFFTAHSLGAWKRQQMGGDPEEMDSKYNFTHRIGEELRVFRSVTAQTVTTEVQKEKLAELYRFPTDNVTVIPAGVDVHRFSPRESAVAKVATGLPERYVLCLGRIDANKGHDLLLNAFYPVLKAAPDIHLVIGGGSAQPQQTELEVLSTMKRIIAEKKMGNNVHIVGYVPEEHLVAAYQQAEFFVLPSVFEPFGITALEAMACGRPVVASRLGGIRDVITSGESGLLVDPTNPTELADAMITLLGDPELAERIGRRGRDVVCEGFSWEAIAARHIALYEKYLDG